MKDRVSELATRHGLDPEKVEDVYQVAFADGQSSGIRGVRPKAAEIRLNRALYEEAYSHGLSVSAWLEYLDPSAEYNDGLNAFERQLKIADIRTQSIPHEGVWAHKVERFFSSEKPGTEWLLSEYIARQWRKVSMDPEFAARFYASNSPVSDVLYPAYIQNVVRQKQIAPAIPLSALVAITTPIDSGVYQAFYLTDSQDERRMRRVAEGAEVPTAILTGSDHTIHVKKYGRRLEGSYETFRRMNIDRFALHLQLLAVQAESDKVATAIDVIVNGDGNSGTAATNSNLTALDGDAVAGTLTLKGFLAWGMLWNNPYTCTTTIAQSSDMLQLMLLNLGSSNTPFVSLQGRQGFGTLNPINPIYGSVDIGWTADAPANKLMGIDRRFGIEMVTEIGATLTETDKLVGQQLNEIVMTESIGFCIFDTNVNRTLTINA